ncbi:MAG TPA: bifunctional biotin--[acetyl-CoA-carboxylase] ligase/biotin operon repressor BirA [Gammaproteobacteria bacterium]|nr:bifunctional biotin--[acetyl-CoA-carboxylase] ligase/biotin operon repressor BirA [Gammaproteobacteria bacterium]
MQSISESTHTIVRMLADGCFHSGEQIAKKLNISRSAVWKHVRRLESFGLEIFSVPGRGYQLTRAVELLDETQVRNRLTPGCNASLQALTVLDKVDSTNSWLMSRACEFPAVCLAEWQTSGRGRRGRKWISPFAANLYLSLGWHFNDVPPGFTALGMVAAIAAVRALHAVNITDVAIKWPNDLLVAGSKLGGILVEVQGEPPGRVRAVIGIGINVRMPEEAAAQIDQPWTDLATLATEAMPGRNHLAAAMIEELVAVLQEFAVQGFGAFTEDWRALDLVAGRPVHLQYQQQIIDGTALGVDQDGALLLHTEAGTRRFVSGDLSLRIQP